MTTTAHEAHKPTRGLSCMPARSPTQLPLGVVGESTMTPQKSQAKEGGESDTVEAEKVGKMRRKVPGGRESKGCHRQIARRRGTRDRWAFRQA